MLASSQITRSRRRHRWTVNGLDVEGRVLWNVTVRAHSVTAAKRRALTAARRRGWFQPLRTVARRIYESRVWR
jgi:hypothetical protein